MPTPEEEFDALSPEEKEFDSLGQEAAAPSAPTAEHSTAEDIGRGFTRGVYGNLGTGLANLLLGQRKEIDGIPATYAGSDVGQSLEQDWRDAQARSPIATTVGQAVSGGAAAGAGGAVGSALGAGAGSALGSAAGPLGSYAGGAIGGMVGGAAGGFTPYALESYSEQPGTIPERVAGAEQFMKEHPVATAVNATAPLVGEAIAPVATKVGQKMIDAGNRGLARIGLSPAHLARLRALGGQAKLAETGQAMRDAGLDKGRDIIQKVTPTDANRIAENAAEKIETLGGQGGKIHDLEDQIMSKIGDTEVDMAPVTDKLRAEAAEQRASADLGGARTARSLEQQAQKFVPEQVPVEAQQISHQPPPVPRYDVEAPLLDSDATMHGEPPASLSPAEGAPIPDEVPAQQSLNLNPGPAAVPEQLPLPGLEPPPAAPPAMDPDAVWEPHPGEPEPLPPPPAPPEPPTATGTFAKGGTQTAAPVPATVEKPYDLSRLVKDKRVIGNRLFDKAQRPLESRYGEDKAREISWKGMKDLFEQELNKAAGTGKVDPNTVGQYRKASKDFHTAADVLVPSARKAETELRRAPGVLGAAQNLRDMGPGTAYNLGRLLKGSVGKGVGRSTVGAMSSPIERAQQANPNGSQTEVEQTANQDMKSRLFEGWYNMMAKPDSEE